MEYDIESIRQRQARRGEQEDLPHVRDIAVLLAEVDRLRGAIAEHRDDVHSQEWEGNPADERLWAQLHDPRS